MVRAFLAGVGILYLVLAVICSVRPMQSARLVGLEIRPGSGQSEFLTLYGGLEFALGVLFLLPILRPAQAEAAIWTCLILHAGLVIFRSVSFLMYSGIEPATYKLAVGEWLIFLGAAFLVWKGTSSSTSS